MRKHVVTCSYWLGSVCAALGLIARGLDAFGMNFIDFSTKGGGVGYHSLMDGTLFFYSISVGSAAYELYMSRQAEMAPAAARTPVRDAELEAIERAYSGAHM